MCDAPTFGESEALGAMDVEATVGSFSRKEYLLSGMACTASGTNDETVVGVSRLGDCTGTCTGAGTGGAAPSVC